MLSAIEGRILGIFFIFYDFPESAVSGALFFDQLFRLYLLADFINLVPGGGNGTVPYLRYASENPRSLVGYSHKDN